MLLEALLIRFALLDRTVDLEALLREMGPAGGASGGGSAPRPQPQSAARPSRADRPGYRADSPNTDTPAAVTRVAEPSPRLLNDAPPSPGAGRTPVATLSVVEEPVADRPLAKDKAAAARPVSTLDVNSIVGVWDEISETVRRERPIFGSLLEHALPSAVTAAGVLTLQVDQPSAHEGLSARLQDLTAALGQRIVGLTRVVLQSPEGAKRPAPARMTAESVKLDTVQSLRKRSALIAAAIDALDLELL